MNTTLTTQENNLDAIISSLKNQRCLTLACCINDFKGNIQAAQTLEERKKAFQKLQENLLDVDAEKKLHRYIPITDGIGSACIELILNPNEDDEIELPEQVVKGGCILRVGNVMARDESKNIQTEITLSLPKDEKMGSHMMNRITTKGYIDWPMDV